VNALDKISVKLGVLRGGFLLALAAATPGVGCAARVYGGEPVEGSPATSEDDTIVYVDTAPPNIEAYPHYSYGGGDAYFVEGRWYRRGPRGWGYYRQEPPELLRQRSNEQRAPAVSRERERPDLRQQPAAPQERSDTRQAPEAPRARVETRQAPEAPRPTPGVVETQAPARGREPPRPARPPAKRTEEQPKEKEHGH
jgi:hypothetical protein